MIAGWWTRWVNHCDRDVDIRPVALLRIFVAACIVGDLLRVAQLGLVDDFFLPYALGGLSGLEENWWLLDDLVGPDRAGFLAYGVTLATASMVLLGIQVRPAIVLCAVSYTHLTLPTNREV